LAEQRPDAVAALVVIDFGPSMDAKAPDRLFFRLLQTRFPGRLLWRMRNETNLRKAVRASGGFTRPVEIPDAFIEDALRMSHRTFVEMLRAPVSYLGQRSLPDRLTALGLPLLVVFGTDDQRWRPSSAHAYSVVPGSRVELLPGVGHTPMMEDPQATAALLLEFSAAVEARNEV
jgi:pimeloyl-ACP methyl ester carboxylesterase